MVYKEVDDIAADLAKKSAAIEARDKGYSLKIPNELRFAIVWTLFFIIIGIIIQSISAGEFIFLDFFAKNYIQWFRNFGNFTDFLQYETTFEFVKAILKEWYYFFYTGGLLSLIWGILRFIIAARVNFRQLA